jgi:prepilin-type N-terminal cleavage/methylation domain-containing protein
MYKKKGFTLVELLAVIVILAIILAIAVPEISGIISSATKGAFQNDAKLIIDAIEYQRLLDNGFIYTDITQDNIESTLNLSNSNYETVKIEEKNGKPYITIVGKNKWEGFKACGDRSNMIVANSDDLSACVESTPESCFTFDSGTKTITGYDSTTCTKDVVMPSSIGGISVEHIGNAAFELAGLTSVIISNSVISIGDYAFQINSFTNVTIPGSVKTIGSDAFASNAITNLTIENGVETIGFNAFYFNSLGHITIPSSVKTIDSNAFANNAITNLTIENGITNIGFEVFAYNQLTSVAIPNSVTNIGGNAFRNNKILQGDATIDNNVSNVTVDATAFTNNGATNTTTITPVFLR